MIDQDHAARSRRQFLQHAAVLAGGGLLAACAPAGSPATPAKPAASGASAPASPTAGAASAPAKPSGSLDKVRLVSWSQPRAEQANFFAADDLGYFRDE